MVGERAIPRLCRAAGAVPAAGEALVCRRLGQWMLWASVAEAAPRGASLVLKRSSAVLSTLEGLVADSILTARAADFLEKCVLSRVPLLVVGSRAYQAPAVVAALAAVDMPGPVIALTDLVDYLPERVGVVRWDPAAMARSAPEVGRAAAALWEARIVAELSSPASLVTLVYAVAAGLQGVLAYAPLSDFSHALAGLPALGATELAGAPPEAVRRLVANCMGVAVEVGTQVGLSRVTRIAEVLAGPNELEVQDIFTLRGGSDGGKARLELEPTSVEPAFVGRALHAIASGRSEPGNG